jgi:hypothetical protein
MQTPTKFKLLHDISINSVWPGYSGIWAVTTKSFSCSDRAFHTEPKKEPGDGDSDQPCAQNSMHSFFLSAFFVTWFAYNCTCILDNPCCSPKIIPATSTVFHFVCLYVWRGLTSGLHKCVKGGAISQKCYPILVSTLTSEAQGLFCVV